MKGHSRWIHGLAFSPDGRTLASWNSDRGLPSEVKLWDPVSARELGQIPRSGGKAWTGVDTYDMAFSSDGRGLVLFVARWLGGETHRRVLGSHCRLLRSEARSVDDRE